MLLFYLCADTRLNKELLYFHSNLGISPSEEQKSDSRQDEIIKLPAHLAEFDFILPLLASYDYKINSLEAAVNINQYKN